MFNKFGTLFDRRRKVFYVRILEMSILIKCGLSETGLAWIT